MRQNTDVEEKISKVQKCQDGPEMIREFENIIKSKKKNIIWLAYQ